MSWIVDMHPLSPDQKGFMTRNCLQGHVCTLKTAVSDFLHSSGKVFVCFVDINDACGSKDRDFKVRESLKAACPEI